MPRGSSSDHGVMVIDTTFDSRTDAAGKDPDTYSATLCRYHQLLWSKPLPSGLLFELVPTSHPPHYFSHSSEAGNVFLVSLASLRRLSSIRSPVKSTTSTCRRSSTICVALPHTIAEPLLRACRQTRGQVRPPELPPPRRGFARPSSSRPLTGRSPSAPMSAR